MKTNFSLPKVEINPPCPPRIYARLYGYLDSALPASRTALTPKTKRMQYAKMVPASTHSDPSWTRKKYVKPHARAEIPSWVMPTVRELCKRLDAGTAPHHVLAGVSSVLHGLTSGQAVVTGCKTPALIIVVACLVLARLSGTQTSPDAFLEQRTLGLTLMAELREKQPEIEAISGVDVNLLMVQIAIPRWTNMDWFQNIPQGPAVAEQTRVREEDEGPARPLASVPSYLLPGLGTMVHAKIDYLGDEYCHRFAQWRQSLALT